MKIAIVPFVKPIPAPIFAICSRLVSFWVCAFALFITFISITSLWKRSVTPLWRVIGNRSRRSRYISSENAPSDRLLILAKIVLFSSSSRFSTAFAENPYFISKLVRFQQKTKSVFCCVFCCEAICVHKEGNIKEVTVSEIKWFWISHLINWPLHTRDFSRELSGFSCIIGMRMV